MLRKYERTRNCRGYFGLKRKWLCWIGKTKENQGRIRKEKGCWNQESISKQLKEIEEELSLTYLG